MGKDDKIILSVKRNLLLGDHHFEGFSPVSVIDYESRILENFEWKRRGDIENDPSHKHPIGYCLIVNPKLKKVFSYQRAKKDQNYHEKRLQGKWSWGIGGHIDKEDSFLGNPIHSSMIREMEEEVGLVGVSPKVLGYINYEGNEVSKVHFGILYIVETDRENITPNDGEMASGELRSIEELEKICSMNDVEEWSQIALAPLRDYFASLK